MRCAGAIFGGFASLNIPADRGDMVIQNDAGPRVPKGTRPPAKDAIIAALDVLRTFRPGLRRYVRDYPAHGAVKTPGSARTEDILLLVGAGLLDNTGTPPCLTPLGEIARGEIWRAEQYVAEHFTLFY